MNKKNENSEKRSENTKLKKETLQSESEFDTPKKEQDNVNNEKNDISKKEQDNINNKENNIQNKKEKKSNNKKCKKGKTAEQGKHSTELIKKEKKTIIKRIQEILNFLFNSPVFPIVIGIGLILKTIFFYLNSISIRETIDKDTVIGTIAFVGTLFCVICALPNRGRTIITIIVDILLSFLLFADNVYHTYSSSVLSVAQLTNLQYSEEILGSLPILVQKREIIYCFDILIIILCLCTRIIKVSKKPKTKKRTKALKLALVIIAVVLFLKVDVDYIKRTEEDPFNKDMQVKKSTIYGYHISDIENTINIKKQAKYETKEELLSEYEELKEEYDEEYGEINYDLEGIAEGKNVIILQLESIQEFVINMEINGQEVTPNLNKFISENIEFSNMFMQSYSSTADSEFSSITSLYPMENGMSYTRYYTNKYDNIFTMFENEGYTTSYMHGNEGYFWNRGNVYQEFGVDNIELLSSFEDTSEFISGYLSDELLYTQAVEKLQNYDTPFVTYIVSASSHTAFTLDGLTDRSKISIDVGEYKDTTFGNYLEAVNYADYAFGVFIEELKEADLYDDTVMIVFGDHNGMAMYEEEMHDYLKEQNPNLTDTDLKLNYIRVACAMKIPGVNNITIEKPVSKLDIKPTFAYLTNGDAGFSLGTNMFASKDFICLNNERIVTEEYYFDEKWFRIKDGIEVDLESLSSDEREKLENYYEKMRKELDISISISINNLLK